MERIKLSKDEKKVLIWLSNHSNHFKPDTFPQHYFNLVCYQLEAKNLVHCGRVEGGDVEAIRLTAYGKGYLFDNPKLRNPINWDRILIIISALTGIIGLFTGCIAYSRTL